MNSLVRVSEINQSKAFKFNLFLTNEEISKLAKRLGLLSLRKVSLKGHLSPYNNDIWKLAAELRATVKQKCVVTLKPVQTIVNEKINRTYTPLKTAISSEIPDDGTSPVYFDDTLQEFKDTIDLIDIIFEELLLILPLYPKFDGAELGSYIVTEPGEKPLTDENIKPFAQLSKLKDKLEKNK